MMQLPLFPLNTVLFPGVPLNLHIFEPRYKAMIRHCLSESQPFGVVLIRKGREALGPLADPHPVGCSAAIIKTEPLADGRMNIAAVGVDRFRIQSLNFDKPYLVGQVEKYPVDGTEAAGLEALTDKLRPWVVKYLQIIAEKLPDDIDTDYLPDEPAALTYLSAYLLQAPASDKQVLLEKQTLTEMMAYLVDLYRRENALMRAMSDGDGPAEQGFGLN